MFARHVSIHLKSNMLSFVASPAEKLQGRNHIVGSLDVVAVSPWDSKANAETYNTNTYPKVLRTFERMIDGAPEVQTFEAATSTFHKLAVGA